VFWHKLQEANKCKGSYMMLLDVTMRRIHKPHQFTMSNLPFGMKCFVINMKQTGSAVHFCALCEVPVWSVKVGEVQNNVLNGT
jgi:hypothetical protein